MSEEEVKAPATPVTPKPAPVTFTISQPYVVLSLIGAIYMAAVIPYKPFISGSSTSPILPQRLMQPTTFATLTRPITFQKVRLCCYASLQGRRSISSMPYAGRQDHHRGVLATRTAVVIALLVVDIIIAQRCNNIHDWLAFKQM